MGFLDSVKSMFAGGGGSGDGHAHWLYVRCRRCGEVIKTRLDLKNDLTPRDEGGFIARKTMVGSQLCFERIEVTLIFDERRQVIEHQISGGDVITAAEFEAAQGLAD
jgi:hypothetical protein